MSAAVLSAPRSVGVCCSAPSYRYVAVYLGSGCRCLGASVREVSEPRGCEASHCGAADVPVGGSILVEGTETGFLDLTAETCHQRYQRR